MRLLLLLAVNAPAFDGGGGSGVGSLVLVEGGGVRGGCGVRLLKAACRITPAIDTVLGRGRGIDHLRRWTCRSTSSSSNNRTSVLEPQSVRLRLLLLLKSIVGNGGSDQDGLVLCRTAQEAAVRRRRVTEDRRCWRWSQRSLAIGVMSLREGTVATKEIRVLIKLHLLEPKLLHRVHKALTGSAPVVTVMVVIVVVVVLVPVVAGVVIAVTVAGLGGIRSRDRGNESLALGDDSRVMVLTVDGRIQVLRVTI